MYKIKYDYTAFTKTEGKTVKTRVDPDDPLMERFNDRRTPIEQYKAGEEYIYFNGSNFDTDFIVEDEDIKHPLYSRGAYEYCVLGIGRSPPLFPSLQHCNIKPLGTNVRGGQPCIMTVK